LFDALDVGAVTTTVPGRGLVYVYSAQSGVTRLMHVELPDWADAVSIRGPEPHPARVHARTAVATSAPYPRAHRNMVGMVQMVPAATDRQPGPDREGT
jgi:hypothetical protein